MLSVRDQNFTLEDIKIEIFFPEKFQNSNLSVNVGEFEFEGKEKTKVLYNSKR